ncbi:hypothetical protein F4692_004082 [Nocardioides cavernae]|uniref:Class F sortase n=1 Tax=Nocardioides cavernae TaxID=1921566 RepID=A0A7Y9H6Q4_9ACTN|nr:class F sortase [Nocardioides cavernae]NYE38927.1 hypothetical protein [Nocardioides cavernae]
MRILRTLVPAAVAVLVVPGCASTDADPSRTRTPSTSASATASPTSSPAASPDAESSVPAARRAESVVSPQAPRLVVLPSGRRVPVDRVGTTPAGVLDVPADVDNAGWWRGGSRIGDPFGSVLVAAHVDSRTQGLGPFAELLTLEPGTRVVLESSRLRQVFRIDARRLVPQGSLADDSWIFDASGDLRLTLVTCAPPYEPDRGGYQNLAVVTAVPLGPPEDQ